MGDTTLGVLIKLTDGLTGPLNNIIPSLQKLGKQFQDLEKYASLAGGAIAAALGFAAKGALDAADKLVKMSAITGVSVGNLQKLGALAISTGTDINVLSTAMRMLSQHAEFAAEGQHASIQLFRELGIAIYDATGHLKPAEQLMYDFADVISKTGNSTQQMAMTLRALGRGGTDILPILRQGSAAMKAMGVHAEEAGLVMSNKTVESLAILKREFNQLITIFVNMTGNWMANAGVTIPKLIDVFVGFATSVNRGFALIKVGAQALWMAIRAAGEVIGAVWNAVAIDTEVAVNKSVGYFYNLIKAVGEIAVAFGIIDASTLTNTLNTLDVMTNKGTAQKFGDGWAAASTKIQSAYRNLPEQVDKATKEIIKDTDAGIADLNENTNKIKKTMSDTATTVHNTVEGADGMKASLNILNDSAHTVFGGLSQAIQDFVEKAGNWKSAWSGMFSSMESGITSALDTFILKGGRMKDLMKDIFESIEKSFVHMLTSMLTQALLKEFLGLFVTGTGGGGGGTIANSFGGSNLTGMNSGGGGGGGGGMGGIGALAGAAGIGGAYLIGGNAVMGPNGVIDPITGQMGMTQVGTTGGLTMGGALAGISGTLAGLQMERQAQTGRVNVGRSVAGGALAGAAMGATIGSVIPGIGTVIGGVVGAVAGAVQGYTSGKSAKKKQQKAEAEAAIARAEQEAALRAQARELITADIRAHYGGGLADVSAVTDIGQIMSNGISDATLDQMGGAANIMNQSGAIGQGINNIQVSSPITVNATISGAYDTQVLAQDLGIQLAASIRAAASGAGI